MKSTRIAVLLAIILTTTSAVLSKEKVSESSGTRSAGCLVKITTDLSIFPLNDETINSLLCSSSVTGKAGKEILGTSYEQSCEFIKVESLSCDTDSSTKETSRLLQKGGGGAKGVPQPRTDDQKKFFYSSKKEDLGGDIIRQQANSRSREQIIMLELKIALPEDIKPLAKEFLAGLTNNLQQTLSVAYEAQKKQLFDELESAEIRQKDAHEKLSNLIKQSIKIEEGQSLEENPANSKVYKQLEDYVDLSKLRPDMPFEEAISLLENSVSPPLKIVVLWENLERDSLIEKTTPINMNSFSNIELSRALNLMLESISKGFVKLGYTVNGGFVYIGPADSLSLEIRVYDVSGFIRSPSAEKKILEIIHSTIRPDSWFDVGGRGTIRIYQGKLIVNQTYKVHQLIQKLCEKLELEWDMPVDASVDEMSANKRGDLLLQKQKIELEAAGLEARHSAIEREIVAINNKINSKVKADSISTDLQQIVDMRIRQLKEYQVKYNAGQSTSTELTDANEKLLKAKIELAQRREQVGRTAGGEQLENLNNQLTELTISLAEKKAMLEVIEKHLEQAEEQLTARVSIDPEIAQIRIAKQESDMAEQRVNELKVRLDTLKAPIVTVLGAN